jgi:hypothetical protein
MEPVRINFPKSVPAALGGEVTKRLHFVSAQVDQFQLIGDADQIWAVELRWTRPESRPSTEALTLLERNVLEFVEQEVLVQRVVPPRELWRAEVVRPPMEDAFAQLIAQEIAYEAGDGQVGLAEPIISLMNYLDRRVRGIAMALPQAREFVYPTLLPSKVLEDFGYFKSFPQFVMFITRLHNDLDVYKKFISDYTEIGHVDKRIFGFCENVDYCLPPTMCYHTYHQLRGRELTGDEVFTARGKSFRFESKYHSGLERLWDFTIREIVFLGKQSFVLEQRSAFLRSTFELMEELQLGGRCEVANDHFFAAPDVASKIFTQRLMELKYELLLDVAPKRSIACASFNFHGVFFGDAFSIAQQGGSPAVTGCVGFGLERLAYAFICQHGLDPQSWPEPVRQHLRVAYAD